MTDLCDDKESLSPLLGATTRAGLFITLIGIETIDYIVALSSEVLMHALRP